jgi:hypothetical protein
VLETASHTARARQPQRAVARGPTSAALVATATATATATGTIPVVAAASLLAAITASRTASTGHVAVRGRAAVTSRTAVTSRVACRIEAGSFHAATVGGARLLGVARVTALAIDPAFETGRTVGAAVGLAFSFTG